MSQRQPKQQPEPTTVSESAVLDHVVRSQGDRWQTAYGDPPTKWPTNLDTSTPRGMALLLNAMNPATLHITEGGELRMKLCHFVYCIADAEDRETGEVSQAPKLVLIDPQGRTFVTRSVYGLNKMKNFMDVFSEDAWQRGIPIRIREHHSPKTKRTSHAIEIDLTPPE